MANVHGLYLCIIESQIHLLDLWDTPQVCPTFPQCNLSVAVILGTNFTLAELGICEPSPHRSGYCSDMGILHQGYSLSTGSDADSDTEGGMSPEHAIRLWGRGIKSRRSSGLSSRENSALTLTDSDNENKSDDDNGRPFLKYISMLYALCCRLGVSSCFCLFLRGLIQPYICFAFKSTLSLQPEQNKWDRF
jgi:hypothetical protein